MRRIGSQTRVSAFCEEGSNGCATSFCKRPEDEQNNHIIMQNFTLSGEPSPKSCGHSSFSEARCRDRYVLSSRPVEQQGRVAIWFHPAERSSQRYGSLLLPQSDHASRQ